MRIGRKAMLSYAKLISGVVVWLSPILLFMARLPLSVEHGLCCVQIIAGVILYSSSLYLRILKCESTIKELIVFNLVLVPVCLLLYFVEMVVLLLLYDSIYGLPTDIF